MRLSLKPSRGFSAAAWLIVVGSLSGCKDKDAPVAPSEAASSKTDTTVGCPDGTSGDPPRSEFQPALSALRDRHYQKAQKELRNLCEKYRKSATARVWLGDAVLYDEAKDYHRAADEALEHYRAAERLHGAGCVLRPVMHYYLRMGSAYAHLRNDRAQEAEKHLLVARQEWPDSAEVFYHSARARCHLGQVDACLENLDKTLELAQQRRRPLFLRVHRALDDWLVRADEQSEFKVLREQHEVEYQALKRKYQQNAAPLGSSPKGTKQ
jgi:tetratricopeptide (TPR) repeat protein